jgi:hypothetical protein
MNEAIMRYEQPGRKSLQPLQPSCPDLIGKKRPKRNDQRHRPHSPPRSGLVQHSQYADLHITGADLYIKSWT